MLAYTLADAGSACLDDHQSVICFANPNTSDSSPRLLLALSINSLRIFVPNNSSGVNAAIVACLRFPAAKLRTPNAATLGVANPRRAYVAPRTNGEELPSSTALLYPYVNPPTAPTVDAALTPLEIDLDKAILASSALSYDWSNTPLCLLPISIDTFPCSSLAPIC